MRFLLALIALSIVAAGATVLLDLALGRTHWWWESQVTMVYTILTFYLVLAAICLGYVVGTWDERARQKRMRKATGGK